MYWFLPHRDGTMRPVFPCSWRCSSSATRDANLVRYWDYSSACWIGAFSSASWLAVGVEPPGNSLCNGMLPFWTFALETVSAIFNPRNVTCGMTPLCRIGRISSASWTDAGDQGSSPRQFTAPGEPLFLAVRRQECRPQ